MYVRFVTDVGNYGLQGTTADPGFYASWTAVREGAACQAFTPVPSTGERKKRSPIVLSIPSLSSAGPLAVTIYRNAPNLAGPC